MTLIDFGISLVLLALFLATHAHGREIGFNRGWSIGARDAHEFQKGRRLEGTERRRELKTQCVSALAEASVRSEEDANELACIGTCAR